MAATARSPNTPFVIEAAVNGLTAKAVNPNVPRAPDEVVADALDCLAAGAAIIHTHLSDLRLDVEETVEEYLRTYRAILAERPDALLYCTFRAFDDAPARSAHIGPLAEHGVTRLSYIDTGSTNVGEADEEGLPRGGSVYNNTYDDCRYMFDLCHRHGLGPSIAVFEPGFLRVVLAYERASRLPPGAMVKFYFGGDYSIFTGRPTPITFGLPPTRAALAAYLDMMHGSAVPWAVATLGGDVAASPVAAVAAENGGHIRVGLEDFGGERTPTNAELVREAAELARRAGRPVATPAQAALLLGLPEPARAA